MRILAFLGILSLTAAASAQTPAQTPGQAPAQEPLPSSPAPAKPFQAKQEMTAPHPMSADPDAGMTTEQRCDKEGNGDRNRDLSGPMGDALRLYLSQLTKITNANWSPLIPKIVDKPFYKSGEVKVCFAILPSGQLEPNSLFLRAKSDDEALNRAAVGAIQGSVYPRLPAEYDRPRLVMQFNFRYNLDNRPGPRQNVPTPPNLLGPFSATFGYTSKL